MAKCLSFITQLTVHDNRDETDNDQSFCLSKLFITVKHQRCRYCKSKNSQPVFRLFSSLESPDSGKCKSSEIHAVSLLVSNVFKIHSAKIAVTKET